MRALAVLMLLAWAGTAVADTRRDAAAALAAGDTDAALVLVEGGLRKAPRDLALLLLRGHVLLRMSDYEAALAAYKAYLAAGASGGNRRAVERIVANLSAITSTFLRVVVKNGPAQVFVDGRSGRPFCVAAPECKKGVVPGDHLVIIERAGFGRATARVAIEPDTTVTVEKTLVEGASQLALTVVPADAAATIDGEPAAGRGELAPGRHVIAVTRPGYVPRTVDVLAAGGAPVTVEVALRRGVPFAVQPPSATVEVDGAPAEIAGGMIALPVGPGSHTVRARAPGHRSGEAVVPAEPPPGFSVQLTLEALGARLMVANAPAGATLFVDGTARATVPLAAPVELEPGRHQIEVVAPGYLPFRGSADLPAGQAATVRIDELRTRSRTKTWICAGVTGAGVAAGTIFGLLALGKVSDFDDRAPQAGVTHMDPTLRGLADDGNRFARIADVSFGVGLAAFAVGVYFFASEGGGTSEGGIEIGPGGVALSGRF